MPVCALFFCPVNFGFHACSRAFSLRRMGFAPCAIGLSALAQSADDTVRVTVTMNPGGSKTVYQTDGANHQSIAKTRGADGKARGKIIYKLDADGRYEVGRVFAVNGALRFKTLYQYDASGRLAQETQLAKNDSVRTKIVYGYDAARPSSGIRDL